MPTPKELIQVRQQITSTLKSIELSLIIKPISTHVLDYIYDSYFTLLIGGYPQSLFDYLKSNGGYIKAAEIIDLYGYHTFVGELPNVSELGLAWKEVREEVLSPMLVISDD